MRLIALSALQLVVGNVTVKIFNYDMFSSHVANFGDATRQTRFTFESS